MSRCHLLRVFCGDDDTGGNPLAVFLLAEEGSPVEALRPPAGEVA